MPRAKIFLILAIFLLVAWAGKSLAENVSGLEFDSDNKFQTDLDEVQGVEMQQGMDMEKFDFDAKDLQPVEDALAEEAYEDDLKNVEQQELIETYKSDIWEQVEDFTGMDDRFSMDKDMVEDFVDENQPVSDYENTKLYLFVSSSMPDTTLKNYVNALDGNPHAVMVLRGPVDSEEGKKIMPTLEWISKQLCGTDDFMEVDREECKAVTIDINPHLYEVFDVSRVPALVYYPGPGTETQSLEFCEQEIEDGDFLKAYGDFRPSYILNQFQIAKPEDEKLVKLQGWLRRGFWD